MKFSEQDIAERINGVAATAILRMLFDTLLQKKILTEEEIEIILNCAVVEMDMDNKTDIDGRVAATKLFIKNFMQDETEKTLG